MEEQEEHPTKSNRSLRIDVRVTLEENSIITESAKANGMGMSAYLRHLGTGQRTVLSLDQAERNALIGLGRNFNQTMKVIHTWPATGEQAELLETLQQTVNQLKAFLNRCTSK